MLALGNRGWALEQLLPPAARKQSISRKGRPLEAIRALQKLFLRKASSLGRREFTKLEMNSKPLLKSYPILAFCQVFCLWFCLFDQRKQSLASSVSFSFLRCGSLLREPGAGGGGTTPKIQNREKRPAHRNPPKTQLKKPHLPSEKLPGWVKCLCTRGLFLWTMSSLKQGLSSFHKKARTQTKCLALRLTLYAQCLLTARAHLSFSAPFGSFQVPSLNLIHLFVRDRRRASAQKKKKEIMMYHFIISYLITENTFLSMYTKDCLASVQQRQAQEYYITNVHKNKSLGRLQVPTKK